MPDVGAGVVEAVSLLMLLIVQRLTRADIIAGRRAALPSTQEASSRIGRCQAKGQLLVEHLYSAQLTSPERPILRRAC